MNWPSLISDLLDSGLTQLQIAERCKTTQSNVSLLLNRFRLRPNWELGNALKELHAERCTPPQASAQ